MNIHVALGRPDLDAPINPRAVLGNNNPPDTPVDRARDFYVSLSGFLKETPVIESHDDAKKGATFVESARRTIGEMEDTRKALVGPLNDEVKAINEQFRVPRESIQGIMDELKRRLTAFAQAEEARRLQEAEAKRLAAEEAERLAREAEAIEQDAIACVDVGELGVNVATAIVQADRAFLDFKRADRAAVRAEKQIPVRLAGGFGRAVSMRKTETLILNDPCEAIKSIKEAILSSARDYRKLNGSLPAGVSAETERQF
jgi:hypothetical protein